MHVLTTFAVTMNALGNSTSPYLLQHAHNPVNWYPWSDHALQKAKLENKLLLISIGYSACHWCHVMERESFEDEEVATVMNKYYICIKVDREERPDIDQVYMEAVQLMTGRGGWPLNCIALPDQKPVYGGTYFPKENWREILLKLAALWENDPGQCRLYADDLTKGVRESALISVAEHEHVFNADEIYTSWSQRFDPINGGMNRAPKFPMPANYLWLLHYAAVSKNNNALQHVNLTLHKMAAGGLYDQPGGGFARYSTDMEWKVPHFEKMLYDNAQLITLYTRAWQKTHDPFYERIVAETIGFIERELSGSNGAFYSALDADSEGEEGLFYTWKENEIDKIAGEDAALFKDLYGINAIGFWEHDRYILMLNEDAEAIRLKYSITSEELDAKIHELKHIFLEERGKRIRPALDDKIICSWNALMLKACAEAGAVFNKPAWIDLAEQNAKFLLSACSDSGGRLLHTISQRHREDHITVTPIPGFLDDYAFLAEALLMLYQVTFNEYYFNEAERLVELADMFFSMEDGLFYYYTPSDGETLFARKTELQDNVTPSSNAVMAFNLYTTGIINNHPEQIERAKAMLQKLEKEVSTLTQWYSYWARFALMIDSGPKEIVFTGDNAKAHLLELMQAYHPALIIAGSRAESSIDILRQRSVPGKSLIYLCSNRSCQLPAESMQDILSQL